MPSDRASSAVLPLRSRARAVFAFALGALSLGALALGEEAHAQRRLFPIPIPGASARQATPFELAVARGDRALNEGRLDDAQAEFTRAAGLDARDARPPFYLGELALRRERFAEAEGFFAQAIARNPSMAEAHAERGSALRELDRADEARAELEQAVRLDVSLWEARVSLGLLHADAGRVPEALAQFRSAARTAPNEASPALELGVLLARSSPGPGTAERAEAFRMLQSALRAAPRDRSVLASVGPSLRLLGESERAVEVLERARALGPPGAGLLTELAQALWAAGRRPQALARIDEAVTAESSAPTRYTRALMRAEAGDRAGARDDANEALRLAPAGSALVSRVRALLARLAAAPSAPVSPPVRALTGGR